MSTRRSVLVVGAGFAGLASAWALVQAGVEVHLAHDRAGASAFSCGAHDLEGHGAPAGDRAPIDPRVERFIEATDAGITLGDARVVGATGLVRSARGRDHAVLALPNDARARVLLPRVAVGSWDADAVAASLVEQGFTGALAVDATLIKHVDEHRMPLGDLAALHDDPARRAWLVDRLRELLARNAGVDALLLPPMLGIDPSTVDEVRRALAVPIGEALGEVGGPGALRFLRFQQRLLASLGVSVERCGVLEVSRDGVHVGCSESKMSRRDVDAVVLATGGLVGGGLVYRTAEHELARELPLAASGPLHERPAIVRADGEDLYVPHALGAPLDPAGSLFGIAGERLLARGGAQLLAAGLPVDGEQRALDRRGRASRWLHVAGDLTADAPRTTLAAIRSGLVAGDAAARG